MAADRLAIRSVTPNPSSGFVSIRYKAPASGDVKLDIRHAGGELSARLVQGPHDPGEYTAFASGLMPGRYICVLTDPMESVSFGFEVMG